MKISELPDNSQELAATSAVRPPRRILRDAQGRFLLGTRANPGGRPKAEAEVRELARRHGPEAIQRLVELMRSAKQERVRLMATAELLDRGYGRPATTLQAAEGTSLEMTLKAWRELADLARPDGFSAAGRES